MKKSKTLYLMDLISSHPKKMISKAEATSLVGKSQMDILIAAGNLVVVDAPVRKAHVWNRIQPMAFVKIGTPYVADPKMSKEKIHILSYKGVVTPTGYLLGA